MSQVHIVFQVLNYLSAPDSQRHNLLPIDKLLFIFLAKHQGIKGIFPSQQTLSRELKISVRHIRDRLEHLTSTGLISIKKEGRKHFYTIEKLSTIEEPQFPYQNEQRNHSSPIKRNHSSAYSGTTVPTNSLLSNPVNKSEGKAISSFDQLLTKSMFSFSEDERERAYQRDIDIQRCFNAFWDWITIEKGLAGFTREQWDNWFSRERNGKGAKKSGGMQTVAQIAEEHFEKQLIVHEERKKARMPEELRGFIRKNLLKKQIGNGKEHV